MLFMYSAVSSGPLLRKLHASSSERTASHTVSRPLHSFCSIHTLQSVDCPCLKLFQCDLCGGWLHVEVEPVFITLLPELRFRELSLLIVKVRPALGVNSRVVVSDHGVVAFLVLSVAFTFQC